MTSGCSLYFISSDHFEVLSNFHPLYLNSDQKTTNAGVFTTSPGLKSYQRGMDVKGLNNGAGSR